MEREIADTMVAWQKQSHCPDYDYFPEGGYSNFWCHRPDTLSDRLLEGRAGVSMFLSGPHARGFNATSANDFGRYNPAFVHWLAENVAPDGRNTVFRASTQASYDANMRPLAEVFFWTRAKIARDRACFDREKSLYETAVKGKRLPHGYYERWFFFMNPFFCDRVARGQKGDDFYYDNGFDAGVDGNVTKTAVGFWIRRAIDGTFDEFARALDKLIAAYEPALPRTPHFADGSAMTLALDSLVREAASCADGSGRRGSITVSFNSNGRAEQHKPKSTSNDPPTCLDQKLEHVQVAQFDGPPIRFRRSLPRK
jgi:hypothetical protein